ncbi:kinase-like domain-containing protein [Camillea tinctor]|nr:kinase-like domain-containing protein [Camillea tinctor]
MSAQALIFSAAQQAFNGQHYVLEKTVAVGNGSAIIRFRANGTGPTLPAAKVLGGTPPSGRYIAKTWFGGAYPQAQEVQLLQSLAWSEHVVKLVNLPNNPFTNNHYVVMEFLSGGSLEDFKNDVGQVIPTKVLWSIFLCLVKACIAMAYPTKKVGQGVVPEEIYPDVEPDNLAHRDLHPKNILFDIYDPNGREHDMAPRVKLVDFTRAERLDKVEAFHKTDERDWDRYHGFASQPQTGKRNPGIDHNILSIGRVMAYMLGPAQSRLLSAVEYRIRLEDDDVSPSVELLDIIRRCLAVNPVNRPRLEVLLQRVQSRVYHDTTKQHMDNYLRRSWIKQGI